MTLGKSGRSLKATVCLGLMAAATACSSGGATRATASPETFASPPTVERGRTLAALQRDQQRLDDVAFPLLRAARVICEDDDVVPRVGLRYASLASYPPAWQPAAQRALDLGQTPTVTSTPDGFPAASSGLRPGDRIVAAGETNLEDGEAGLRSLEAALSVLREGRDRVLFEVERDGEAVTVELGPGLEACRYGVVTRSDIGMNAYGDGANIVVGSDLLRSATDAELAAVVSHALAHNALDHVAAAGEPAQSTGQLVVAGSVAFASRDGGDAPGTGPQPGSFADPLELEADYVALYALANAGQNVADATAFWARMEAGGSPLAGFATTHPVSEERFTRLEETVAEIEKKREASLPLVPGALNDGSPAAHGEDSARAEALPPSGELSTTPPPVDSGPVPSEAAPTPESRTTLIEELDEGVHVWLRSLDQADFQAASRMTGGVGDPSGLRYWWSAIRGEARHLASTQTLRIRRVERRYVLDVAASFDTGPEAVVEVTVDQAGNVVRWRGAGTRPGDGSGDPRPHC